MNDFITPQQQFALGWDIFPLLPGRKTEYAHILPDGSTQPTKWVNGWERLSAQEVDVFWPPSGGGHNVGVATGARSGVWVLDVDRVLEDEEEAREYVAEVTGIVIPQTLSVRTASGKWHFYFAMPESKEIYISSSVGKLGPNIDVRGDGGMAMGICSSVNDGGEREFYRVITMMKPVYAPLELIERVKRKVIDRPDAAPASVEKDVDPTADALAQVWIEEELQRLRNLHRPWVIGAGWHDACFEVACQLNEFANSPWCSLTPESAQARYLEAAPAPERDWNPMVEWLEGQRKVEGQGRMKPATAADQSWFHEIGSARPSQPRSDGAPVEEISYERPRHWPIAEHQISQVQDSPASYDLASEIKSILPTHDDFPILASHQGIWYYWNGSYWAETDADEVHDFVARQIAFCRVNAPTKDDAQATKPLSPGVAKVRDVVDALATFLRVADDAEEIPGVVHARNGMISIDGRVHQASSPVIFNMSALPFAYDPEADCPQWEAFLMDIFEHDPDAARALQEWFGYILLGDPSWLQKMFWLIGPKRSGKGTILHIAKQLMGEAATATSLTKLSKDFGQENLIGKRLAIIDDARDPDPRVAHSVVEFLLTLSAGGFTSVSRKHRRNWDGTLGVSLLAASNTVPRMPDDGGAISSRLEIIKTRKSFIGHEDTHLGERLSQELPGILNWSLNGLDRLRSQSRFTQAALANEVRIDVDRGATGASPFVKEMMVETEAHGTSRRQIRDAVEWWSQQQEDSYKPTRLAIKAAIHAEFPDAKYDTRATLADGSSDQHAWKGVGIRCRECDQLATRVSPVAGPECAIHLSNDWPKVVPA